MTGNIVSRKTRARAEIRQGKSHEEVFEWLFDEWCNGRMTKKDRIALGFQILPYIKRKKAPDPAPETKKALESGRLLVIGPDQGE